MVKEQKELRDNLDEKENNNFHVQNIELKVNKSNNLDFCHLLKVHILLLQIAFLKLLILSIIYLFIYF